MMPIRLRRFLLFLPLLALFAGSRVGSNPLEESQTERLYAEADAAFDRENYPESESLYLRIVQRDDQDPGAWMGVGMSRFREGRYPVALEAFLRAESLLPLEPSIQFNLGSTLYKLSKFSDALARFVSLRESDTYKWVAELNRGLCLFRFKKYKLARQAFNRVIAGDQPALGEIAERMLKKLDESSKDQSPPAPDKTKDASGDQWKASLQIAGGYDSNVLFASEEAPTEERKNDTVGRLGLALGRDWKRNYGSASISYAFDQEAFIENDAYNYYSHEARARLGPRLGAFSFPLEYRLSYTSIAINHRVGVEARWLPHPDWETRVGVRRSWRNIRDEDYAHLEGGRTEFWLDQFVDLSPSIALWLGYSLRREKAEGWRFESERLVYSYLQHGVWTGVGFSPGPQTVFHLGLQWRQRQYDQPNLYQTDESEITELDRKDIQISAFLRFRQALFKGISLTFDAEATSNDSSLDRPEIEDNRYQRWVFTCGTILKY